VARLRGKALSPGVVVDRGGPVRPPFGLAALEGVTAARLGLVAVAWCMFAIRQNPTGIFDAISEGFLDTLAFANLYTVASLPSLALVTFADRRTRNAPGVRRLGSLVLAVVAGGILYGLALAGYFLGLSNWANRSDGPLSLAIASFSLRGLLGAGLLAAVLHAITRDSVAAEALQATRVKRAALEQQLAEARLRVLQSQIEPHFLFNTLAHVKRLYAIDPRAAKSTLGHLGDYLREALPQMREHTSTLGRELALVHAYLAVLQVRMGERLEVRSDVPDDLHGAELPPMILSTLVENAIKHGIGPKPEGGVVDIAARRDGEMLRVSVADDGIGFQVPDGSGIGIANSRARLAALYGHKGLLSFRANPAGGVTVSVSIPCRLECEKAAP